MSGANGDNLDCLIGRRIRAVIETRQFLQRLRQNQGHARTAEGRRREADRLLLDYPLACHTREAFAPNSGLDCKPSNKISGPSTE